MCLLTLIVAGVDHVFQCIAEVHVVPRDLCGRGSLWVFLMRNLSKSMGETQPLITSTKSDIKLTYTSWNKVPVMLKSIPIAFPTMLYSLRLPTCHVHALYLSAASLLNLIAGTTGGGGG